MENSALNKAHQQHRQADAHLRCRRYANAIECHKNALELLTEALKCTDNPRSLESIRLQIDFHARQKTIVNIKREQYENYRAALEQKYADGAPLAFDDKDGNMLTVAIYQTIEDTDSLIELIQKQRETTSDTDSTRSGVTTDTDNTDELDAVHNHIAGVKHPKDDKTIIEEFKILNKQLHLLVSQLVNQLEGSKKENELLKCKLKQYECDKVQNNKNHGSSNNSLKVGSIATDSSGGTSPYVFSPCSEFALDPIANLAIHPPAACKLGKNELNAHAIPPLAPLSMPNFDFASNDNDCYASVHSHSEGNVKSS